jgi:hypothetical protein
VKPRFDILYCHARRNAKKIAPGHWFFHTGQWAVCANTGKDEKGEWRVQVYWDRPGKESPEGKTFSSIEDVLKFVGDYFEQPVVKVNVRQMPRGEDDL